MFLLCGCASFKMPTTFSYKQINTNGFNISAWVKTDNSFAPYHVYIEGDGSAFNAHGQPTNDPTPRSYFMRRLASEDAGANVIYLARPCQFTKGIKCTEKYWTTARFAPDVIKAEYHTIKALTNNNQLILIGYSGGAQVAGLLATTTDLNVTKVVTIAGNLNHKAWTSYHHLPELTESLDLADYKDKFSSIPQIHYIGEKDKVIPPILIEDFISDKSTLHIIPNATHDKGLDNLPLI